MLYKRQTVNKSIKVRLDNLHLEFPPELDETNKDHAKSSTHFPLHHIRVMHMPAYKYTWNRFCQGLISKPKHRGRIRPAAAPSQPPRLPPLLLVSSICACSELSIFARQSPLVDPHKPSPYAVPGDPPLRPVCSPFHSCSLVPPRVLVPPLVTLRRILALSYVQREAVGSIWRFRRIALGSRRLYLRWMIVGGFAIGRLPRGTPRLRAFLW